MCDCVVSMFIFSPSLFFESVNILFAGLGTVYEQLRHTLPLWSYAQCTLLGNPLLPMHACWPPIRGTSTQYRPAHDGSEMELIKQQLPTETLYSTFSWNTPQKTKQQ